MNTVLEECKKASLRMRKSVIEMAYKCGTSAHLGGGLSFIDIISTLFIGVGNFKDKNLSYEEKDKFILSKGHGVLGLYAGLHEIELISKEQLDTFQQNGSDLVAHPVMNLELGIESSNGSLGQGLSMGVGLALAAKKKNKAYHTYVLVGNGECNEGSVWEALMSAVQYNLENLTLIIDNNSLQSDGCSSEIMDLGNLANRLSVFGWNTIEIDGHDVIKIYEAFTQEKAINKPTCIIANTIKGKGISFIENKNEWHHNRLTQELYERANTELEV